MEWKGISYLPGTNSRHIDYLEVFLGNGIPTGSWHTKKKRNTRQAVPAEMGCSRAVGIHVPAAVEPALHRASLHAAAAPVAAAGLQERSARAQQVHERPRHGRKVALPPGR